MEKLINSWEHAVLFISHDETLIENTANRVIHFEQIRRKTMCRHTVANIPYWQYVEERLQQFKKQEQIALGEEELQYIDSVFDALSRAETENDIVQLRLELAQQGYVRGTSAKAKPPKALPPIEYRSSDGFTILVGRNNRQNDQLTLKFAEKSDIWLHTQGLTGSHVIIVCEGNEPPDRTIEEAAVIAAVNSRGRGSNQVPVDYCLVRYVRKPAGAKPGKVIFTNYRTAFVRPDAEIEQGLRV